jgi:hypothetical protein
MSDERFYHLTSPLEKTLVIDEDGLRNVLESYPEVLTIVKERTFGKSIRRTDAPAVWW